MTPQEISTSAPKTNKKITAGTSEVIREDHGSFSTAFKPRKGEKRGMRSSIRGRIAYYHREILAYELSELFSFNLVPMTVKATVDGRVGSRQVWVDGDTCYYFPGRISQKTQSQIARMILFDAVCGNTDRHAGNWVYDEPNKKLWAIDNGLCFPYKTMKESRIEFDHNGKAENCYRDYVSSPLKHNDYSKIRKFVHSRLPKRDMKRLQKITEKEFLALFRSHKLGVEGKDAWNRLQTIIEPLTEKERAAA